MHCGRPGLTVAGTLLLVMLGLLLAACSSPAPAPTAPPPAPKTEPPKKRGFFGRLFGIFKGESGDNEKPRP